MKEWKNAPRKGEIFKNPQLAKTSQKSLQKKAETGFYESEMSLKTMADFDPVSRRVLNIRRSILDFSQNGHHPYHPNYRGYDVWELAA